MLNRLFRIFGGPCVVALPLMYAVTLPFCTPTPIPTPPPPTTTTTTTTPPPPPPPPPPTTTTTLTPSGVCPIHLPDVGSFRVEVKPHGGQQLDVTVYACGPSVVAHLAVCGTSCCPLSHDRGAQAEACELELYGLPHFVGPQIDITPTDNPFTVKIRGGDGTLWVTPDRFDTVQVPGAVRQLHAAAAIPACDVDAGGLCQ